jgi:hypothetical protein
LNQGSFSFPFLSIFAAALFVCRHLPPLIRPPLIQRSSRCGGHQSITISTISTGVTPEQGALNAIDTAACAQPGQISVTTNTGSLATAISPTSSPRHSCDSTCCEEEFTPCRCARDRRRLHCVNPDVLFRPHHSSKLHCSPEIVCFGHNCLGCSWCRALSSFDPCSNQR